jgi:hypothetical protein
MGKIGALVFWMGGIVTASLPSTLAQAVEAATGSKNKLVVLPELNEACNRFWTNQIDDLSLVREACQIAHAQTDPDMVKSLVYQKILHDQQALQIIQTLPDHFQKWLLVDYPAGWCKPVLDNLTAEKWFAPDRILQVIDFQLIRLIPDLYYSLGQRLRLQKDEFLVFDASVKRVIQGVNNGFHSAIFTNPRMLAREFFLRRFTSQSGIHFKPEVMG